MISKFDQDGISFSYPANWELSREETEQGWTVLLQSPQTTFFMLSIDQSLPELDEMADTALDALRSEYEDLESESALGTVAGQPAIGHDIRFFSLDLTNTCWVRAFNAGAGTVLVLWQANDLELGDTERVLKAICASIQVDD